MLKKIIGWQFKKPSGLFGIFTSNLMIKENMSRYDMLIKDLDIQPHDRILEIGYGPGVGIELIAEKCNSCIVHGIDFAKLMYDRATKRNKKYIENNKVLLKLGDILDARIEKHAYHKIFCVNVVYFWDDLQKPFEKIESPAIRRSKAGDERNCEQRDEKGCEDVEGSMQATHDDSVSFNVGVSEKNEPHDG